MSNLMHKVKDVMTGHRSKPSSSSNAGHHDSNVNNKADPRVDMNQGVYDTTGGMKAGSDYNNNNNPNSTNAGPHDSNMANKMDPRVDSDLDNRARHQNMDFSNAPAGSSYATPGTGTAQQTAGPHDSNLANKMDPRVDSDMDNRRTTEGNITGY